ncbi:MAG: periplasmic heavy metal sensor [Telluria sp.]
MSVAHAFSPPARASGSRWLLLGSLALNLFFVGVAVAMAIRAPAPRWDPDVFVRVERLSATLPLADADILRGAYQASHERIADAQTAYQDGRRSIHEILRQEPFKIEDLRDAMARTRTARQAVDQAVQSVFADTVVKLSPAARHAVADWRPVDSSKRDRQ